MTSLAIGSLLFHAHKVSHALSHLLFPGVRGSNVWQTSTLLLELCSAARQITRLFRRKLHLLRRNHRRDLLQAFLAHGFSQDGVGFTKRIDPVDQVDVGQVAKVRFPAFNQRTTPELTGQVRDVSATTSTDEVTGQSFYWVDITVPDEELAQLSDLELIPGMPVEAYLTTTDRTVLSYLTKPLADQLNQAFREE